MTDEEYKARRDAVLHAVEQLYQQYQRPLKIHEVAAAADISKSAAHRYIIWLWADRKIDRTQDGKHGSIVPAGFGGLW